MLMRWIPFREMEAVQREIGQLFEDISGRQHGFGETRFPLIDVSETADAAVVRALLPGMTKDQIKISFHNNVLSVSGEKKPAPLPEGARVIRSERASGRFQRTLRMQKPVDEDDIMARLRDGVLELTLPYKEEAKPRQIELKVE